MKKSVNLYFNTADTKEKLLEIKNLGYDEFFTGIYDAKETIKFNEQIQLAKSLGLDCTMIHCSYYEPDLNNFWFDCEAGDKVEYNYINQIKLCNGLSKNFVVHLNGGFNSKQTIVGLRRIKNLLKVCEENNINLCIENLYSADEIDYIFTNINHPNLKICFDIGHKNFLTPALDIMNKYGEFVTVLHLHDNDGKADLHKIPYTGSVNWNEFAKSLVRFPNLVLSSEIKYNNVDFKKILQENLNALKKLDKTIQSFNDKSK